MISDLRKAILLYRKEANVLFNDTLNTFYLRLYGVRHMVKDHSIVRKETRCRHIGYSFRLTARVLLYSPSHRQDNIDHGLCYTSHGALAETRIIVQSQYSQHVWHSIGDSPPPPPKKNIYIYIYKDVLGCFIYQSIGLLKPLKSMIN